MTLDEQVTSLELSKKLKELGIKQSSLFCWTADLDLEFLPTEIRNKDICIAAFTSAEIGALLTKQTWDCPEIDGKFHRNVSLKYGKNYMSLIGSSEAGFGERTELLYSTGSKNEADARAEMFIYLVEKGLINT